MELLKGSWVLLRVLERLLGGSREALGRLLEASKRHLGPKTVIGSILGVHLGDVLTSKSYFLVFQEGIQHKADFEGVLASILGRFSKVLERQQ